MHVTPNKNQRRIQQFSLGLDFLYHQLEHSSIVKAYRSNVQISTLSYILFFFIKRFYINYRTTIVKFGDYILVS